MSSDRGLVASPGLPTAALTEDGGSFWNGSLFAAVDPAITSDSGAQLNGIQHPPPSRVLHEDLGDVGVREIFWEISHVLRLGHLKGGESMTAANLRNKHLTRDGPHPIVASHRESDGLDPRLLIQLADSRLSGRLSRLDVTAGRLPGRPVPMSTQDQPTARKGYNYDVLVAGVGTCVGNLDNHSPRLQRGRHIPRLAR